MRHRIEPLPEIGDVTEAMAKYGELERRVPRDLDCVGVLECGCDCFRQHLLAGQVDDRDRIVVEAVGKQQCAGGLVRRVVVGGDLLRSSSERVSKSRYSSRFTGGGGGGGGGSSSSSSPSRPPQMFT